MIMMMGMEMMMMITLYLHDSTIIDGMNKNVITVPNDFNFLCLVRTLRVVDHRYHHI